MKKNYLAIFFYITIVIVIISIVLLNKKKPTDDVIVNEVNDIVIEDVNENIEIIENNITEEVKNETHETPIINKDNTKDNNKNNTVVELNSTPTLEIVGASLSDSKTIKSIDTAHVSESFITTKTSNIKITVSGSKYYVYSTATSQDKAIEEVKTAKKHSINEIINIDFSDGNTKVLYIWLVDDKNNKSTHFTRLSISNKEVNVTGIKLNKDETSIKIGNKETLVATIIPENATNRNIIWESLNTNIATVDENGVITPVREGVVIIRAITKDGNKKASIKVHVNSTLFNIPRFITMMSNERKVIKTNLELESLKSSNSSIVKVEGNAIIAKGEGITNVTAISKTGIKEYIRIQVFNTDKYGCSYSSNYMICNKKNSNPTKDKTAAQKEKSEKELDYILSQLDYNKRYQAVESAKYLALYYETQVPYATGEIYTNVSKLKRFNVYDNELCWGCDKKPEEITNETLDFKHGIQCSGFVSWCLINAGLKMYDPKYDHTALISATYLSGIKDPDKWLVDNHKVKKQWYGNGIKTKITSDNNIKSIKNMTWNEIYNLVTPGDLIGKGKNNEDDNQVNDKGHIGIIVDKYEQDNLKYIVVAHSARWKQTNGPQLTRYSDVNSLRKHWDAEGWISNVVLMKDVYSK